MLKSFKHCSIFLARPLEYGNYQVIESAEQFKEKTLASKERLAERRIANKNPNTPGQITQNNTYIFDSKEQFKIMKDLNLEPQKIEEPGFDLS